MAKTSAERQAAYRAKRAGQHSVERRLNTWVSTQTDLTLEKLAGRYGVTKRAVIELLVLNEDGKLKELTANPGVASGRSKGVLRGNAISKPAGQNQAPKKRSSEKLGRKGGQEVVNKESKNQSTPEGASISSKSLGDQFGFEF